MRLLPLFLILPLVEIALFVLVGGWIGLWPTLGLVLLSGILGVIMMRCQGLRAVNELRGDLTQMQNPLSPIAHRVLTMLASGLLILPGFFTSAVGLLLLIPPLRQLLIEKLGAKIKMAGFAMPGQAAPQGQAWQKDGRSVRDDITVIDAEYFEIDENEPPRGPSGWTRH